ncbi:hypothetical protein GCM10011491_28580 [Brucella endophytica]|uniref:Uncharacterized protein n=1 Tax=Brucella endophytica TaxID=1963359 RepID=A0A916SFQ0_9HYPH|nr:hypothetical protein [Brucella endophytica]GGA98610.1 hypothetical protein GCM10011491_28580 [Brucella endophytica]
MNSDCFTWHADQDDVYDGAQCGATILTQPPSAFNKNQPYGFTMKGGSLTLQTAPVGEDTGTSWAPEASIGSKAVTFNIESGTFVYNCAGGSLSIGNDLGLVPNVNFRVTGNCSLNALGILGQKSLIFETPCTQIDIHDSGNVSMSGEFVGGGFNVNIGDTGTMRINADRLGQTASKYMLVSGAPVTGHTLLMTTLGRAFPTPDPAISFSHTTMVCKSSSRTRLETTSMSLEVSNIYAGENATVEIACDTMTVDNSSFFTLSQGSATATIIFPQTPNPEGWKLPFNPEECPKGMFNFITKEGLNIGSFRFSADSAFASSYYYQKMQNADLIAIDGEVWANSPINGWTVTYVFNNSHLVISLRKSRDSAE